MADMEDISPHSREIMSNQDDGQQGLFDVQRNNS